MTPERKSSLGIAIASAVVVTFAIQTTGSASAAPSAPTFIPTIAIQPPDPIVFAGAAMVLRAFASGALGASAGVRWSLVGPGTLQPAGDEALYQAPSESGTDAVIAAAQGTAASAVTVRTTKPPSAGVPLAIVTCYDSGLLDVRDARTSARIGELTAGSQAGGIAIDARRHIALVTARDRVVALDLRTMRPLPSTPHPGAQFSSVAQLAGGFFAVTDANARRGDDGVLIFRVDDGGRPLLAGAARSGETPEGIAASRDGRAFYVTQVNDNSLARYGFDGRGTARLTKSVRTGPRPFDVALDERDGLAFVTDNDTPYLSGVHARPGLEMFELASLERRGHAVSTGSGDALPLGVAVDETLREVFVTNEGDATVAAYRIPTMQRISTWPTGLTPWLPTIDQRRHLLFVPSARGDEVRVFDTRARLAQPVRFGTCSYPTAVAIADGGFNP